MNQRSDSNDITLVSLGLAALVVVIAFFVAVLLRMLPIALIATVIAVVLGLISLKFNPRLSRSKRQPV
jgi:uncharacterized protein YacL